MLSYSSYLGGATSIEWGYGIAVDSAGNAYVTGETGFLDFPVVNALQSTHGGGGGYVHVFDDANAGFVPLSGTPNSRGWVKVSWAGYNSANGTTWPAVGE